MNDACMIMMAAYNSERFLREQLDSIINQTHENWKLVIRDDNSVDGTVEIIREYMDRDDRIELILNHTDLHGAYINFYSLISECRMKEPYDYYLFSDHDDVWLPDKIKKLLERCQQTEIDGGPVMVYGDMKIIDADGNVLEGSMARLTKTDLAASNPIGEFFNSSVHGCNMIMNRKLFFLPPVVNVSSPAAAIIPHDIYYPDFAAIKGDIEFIYEPLMLYRRYGGNVSKNSYSYGMRWMLGKLRQYKEFPFRHAEYYNISLFAISQLKQADLTLEEKELIDQIEAAIRYGGWRAVRFCMKHHIVAGLRVRTIGKYIMLFTGAYKKYLIKDCEELQKKS